MGDFNQSREQSDELKEEGVTMKGFQKMELMNDYIEYESSLDMKGSSIKYQKNKFSYDEVKFYKTIHLSF